MSDINLSLKSSGDDGPHHQTPPPSSPVAGYFAIGLALLGIFTTGYVFVPLAFLASVIALFSGQIIWGIFGVLLSTAGLLTSPVLLTFLGLAWFASVIGL